MNLTPNEILDKTLAILKKDVPPTGLTDTMLDYYEVDNESALYDILDRMENDPFEEVLDKLVDDGYVREVGLVGEPSLYFITFDGRVFSQNGGYVRKAEIDNLEREQAKSNAQLALVGAWVAAIAALAFLIWDIIKYFLEHYHPLWSKLSAST